MIAKLRSVRFPVMLAAIVLAAVTTAPALSTPAVASNAGRTVDVVFPADRDLQTGEVAEVTATVDTTQPTTIHFEKDVDGTWVDLASSAVPAGATSYAFDVPTGAPGVVTVRVVVDADTVSAEYVSPTAAFTVTGHSPSTITVSGPGVSSVRVGTTVRVSGTVGGMTVAARRVRLELDTRHGWMGVGRARTDAAGDWSARVPTDWYYSGTLRAKVLATDTDAAAISSRTFTMTVRPDYRPGGHADQWTYLAAGLADYHWNPCDTITYEVNLTGAPDHALKQVKQAFARVHTATGFTFAYDGTTSAIPYRTDGRGRKRSGADFTLAFASDRQVSGLSGYTIGLGGWLNGSGGQILEGAVVLDRNAHLKAGFRTGATWGSLLLHEIGHAMNLGHAVERHEVMHGTLYGDAPGRYQAGDLAGLRRVGATSGCIGSGDATPWRTLPPTWHLAR